MVSKKNAAILDIEGGVSTYTGPQTAQNAEIFWAGSERSVFKEGLGSLGRWGGWREGVQGEGGKRSWHPSPIIFSGFPFLGKSQLLLTNSDFL